MQLGQSLTDDSYNSIVLIKPLRINPCKIILWVLFSFLCVSTCLISVKLMILVLIIISTAIYYLIVTHSRVVLTWWIYSLQDKNSAEVTRFAIFDVFSGQKNESERRSQGKVQIVKVYHTNQSIKYFKFNEIIYKVKDQTVEVINQVHLLNILKIQTISNFTQRGLDQQKIQISQLFYGKQQGYMSPSLWQMVFRRFTQDQEWLIVIFIAKVIAVLWNLPVFLILLVLDLLSIAILCIERSRSTSSFIKKYEWIANKQFNVIRDGVQTIIGFQDILVGDIIVLQKDEQYQELTIYFKSLLISDQYQIVIKQEDKKEKVVKRSIKNEGRQILQRFRAEKYVIKASSSIQNSDLLGGQRLLVVDNKSISRLFSLWFQKPRRQQFSSLFKQKYKQAGILIIGYVFFILIILVILKITARTFTQQFDPSITDQMFLSVLSVPSIIYFLFSFNSLMTYHKLMHQGIQLSGNTLQRAALLENMLLNFSDLVELQLLKVLSKYQIFDLSIPPFDPNRQTLQNSASYESLLALILYVSLGHFEQKDTFLKKVFQHYEGNKRYYFEDSLGQYEDVGLKDSKKWSILKIFPEIQNGWRSWLLKYDNRIFYVITQGTYRQDTTIFQKLIGSREDQTKIDVYKYTAQTLIEEGKKFKYMFFRSLKDRDRPDKLNQSQVPDLSRTEVAVSNDYASLSRQRLQKNLEFGAFIIFDNAFKQQSIETIQYLSKANTQSGNSLLNIGFFSSKNKQTMAGFQHLLVNIPFNYELSQHEKQLLIVTKIKEGGLLLIGGKEDHFALHSADISVQLQQQIDGVANNLLMPSDFCLKELSSVTTLFDTGNWIVWIRLQIFKYVLLVTMNQLVILLFLGTRGHQAKIEHSLLWGIAQQLLFVIFPLMLFNLMPVNSLLCSKAKYNFLTVTFVIQMLVIAFSIIVLIIAAEPDLICQNFAAYQQNDHLLRLRVHLQQNYSQECLNIPLVSTATTGVILFSIVYLQKDWTNARLEWWRYCIIGLWVGVLLISKIPMILFWRGLSLLVTLVLIKYFIRFAIFKPQQR